MLEILRYPDPRLRARAAPVVDFDESFQAFVREMTATVEAAEGLGLSAMQVGDRRAVLVLVPTQNPDAPRVYANPEILEQHTFGLVEESCLSIPGIVGNVIRATELRVRAQDETGRSFECSLSGMDAVCLQHEIDHLSGTLFIDRLSMLRRLVLRARGVRTRRTA